MDKLEFIPGKKYHCASWGDIWIYIGPNAFKPESGIFQNENRGVATWSYTKYSWKEYIEPPKPRSGSKWIVVWESSPGNIYSTSYASKETMLKSAKDYNRPLAIKEVPWVEGEGLELLE